MKTNVKWLLNMVNSIVNVLWYVNMVLFVVAFFVLTVTFIENRYTDMSMAVKYKQAPAATTLKPLLSQLNEHITIQEDQALIKMHVAVTPGIMITAYFLLLGFETLVIVTLYNLRKLFKSIKQQQPFEYNNIRRLKIIALCLALFTPLNILYGLLSYITLTGHIEGFNSRFMMVWSDSFIGVILGAVIYIMADIFSYGFELKKEIEEFV